PAAVQQPAVAAQQSGRESAATRRDEAPWARVEKKRAAAPAAVAPPAVAAVPAARQGPAARPVRSRVSAPAVDVPSSLPAPDPGEPGVRVQSASYSVDPSERFATLRIGGAGAVTLHEGESAHGIEVQLILRDMVYVRQGSSIIALGVPTSEREWRDR